MFGGAHDVLCVNYIGFECSEIMFASMYQRGMRTR